MSEEKKTEKKELEKKEIFGNECDEELFKIDKNIDFCQTNNCPEALLPGGKYFQAFKKLVYKAASFLCANIKDNVLVPYFPIPENKKEEWDAIQNSVILKYKIPLLKATKEGSKGFEKIMEVYTNILKDYCDVYNQNFSFFES